MTWMNPIIDLSSDEEGDKLVQRTDLFEGTVKASDESTGHRKSNSWDLTVEDDDDCVILDGDPDKTKEMETTFGTCETDDDILVVGQKGEIACRDFPHPRHACAKYPFNSTSHDKYCDMCHCYVCDIRAPCPRWCISISSMDHCHANDKEQIWKNQRECIRTGKILPRPALTIPHWQQRSQSQSLRSPYFPPVNQLGIRACSASTMAATRPNTYIRPGYRPVQSRTFLQNPMLQPRAPQFFQNQRSGSYNGNPNQPQMLSSNNFTWTQRPSGGATLLGNGVHNNIARGSQYNRYAPPVALQNNSQRSVPGYFSNVPESQSREYDRHFSRLLHSGNVQTSGVPSETPNPPAQQQQQQSATNTDVLSEIEEFLMDINTPTDPVCPMSGQVNSTTLRNELEPFLEWWKH